MNRRSFLSLFASVPVVAMNLPLIEVPKRTIFLPPKGGWGGGVITGVMNFRDSYGPFLEDGSGTPDMWLACNPPLLIRTANMGHLGRYPMVFDMSSLKDPAERG